MKARIEEVLSRILSRKHRAKVKVKFERRDTNGGKRRSD